jgi:hypothetical protein
MLRRSFIKRATLAAAAFALGLHHKPSQLPSKRVTPNPRVNPHWINAPYQVDFLFAQHALDQLHFNCGYRGFTFATDPFPLRFHP